MIKGELIIDFSGTGISLQMLLTRMLQSWRMLSAKKFKSGACE